MEDPSDGAPTEAELRKTVRCAQRQVDTLDPLVLPSRGLLLKGRM